MAAVRACSRVCMRCDAVCGEVLPRGRVGRQSFANPRSRYLGARARQLCVVSASLHARSLCGARSRVCVSRDASIVAALGQALTFLQGVRWAVSDSSARRRALTAAFPLLIYSGSCLLWACSERGAERRALCISRCMHRHGQRFDQRRSARASSVSPFKLAKLYTVCALLRGAPGGSHVHLCP